MAKPPRSVLTVPPTSDSTVVRPMYQEVIPGPVAIASHTWSTVTGSSASLTLVHSCPISVLLNSRLLVDIGLLVTRPAGARVDSGVHRDDDPVVAALLVVVLRHQIR